MAGASVTGEVGDTRASPAKVRPPTQPPPNPPPTHQHGTATAPVGLSGPSAGRCIGTRVTTTWSCSTRGSQIGRLQCVFRGQAEASPCNRRSDDDETRCTKPKDTHHRHGRGRTLTPPMPASLDRQHPIVPRASAPRRPSPSTSRWLQSLPPDLHGVYTLAPTSPPLQARGQDRASRVAAALLLRGRIELVATPYTQAECSSIFTPLLCVHGVQLQWSGRDRGAAQDSSSLL